LDFDFQLILVALLLIAGYALWMQVLAMFSRKNGCEWLVIPIFLLQCRT
jgi:hypothetical protein